jgi:hypothetical protein
LGPSFEIAVAVPRAGFVLEGSHPDRGELSCRNGRFQCPPVVRLVLVRQGEGLPQHPVLPRGDLFAAHRDIHGRPADPLEEHVGLFDEVAVGGAVFDVELHLDGDVLGQILRQEEVEVDVFGGIGYSLPGNEVDHDLGLARYLQVSLCAGGLPQQEACGGSDTQLLQHLLVPFAGAWDK